MSGLPVSGIDTHAHIFEPNLNVVDDARYVPDYSATLEQYLSVLSENGMSHGVLVQPSFLGWNNSYLLDALAQEPVRLRGVIVVEGRQLNEELSAGRMEHLHQAGIRGVRLNLIGRELPELMSQEWQSAAIRFRDYGWHLEIQASVDQWHQLEDAVVRWPSWVVIDHLGLPDMSRPESVELFLRLATCKQVWFKVSGPYRSSYDDAARMVSELLATGAVERMVFGSDWPFTRHEKNEFSALKAWATQVLGESHAKAIFVDNPMRLFGW